MVVVKPIDVGLESREERQQRACAADIVAGPSSVVFSPPIDLELQLASTAEAADRAFGRRNR